MAKRLLIAEGEAGSSADELPFGVREPDRRRRGGPRHHARPADPLRMASFCHGKAREHADKRLAEVLGQLEEAGSPASGEVGADDPILAFEDALADFSVITS